MKPFELAQVFMISLLVIKYKLITLLIYIYFFIIYRRMYQMAMDWFRHYHRFEA